MIELISKEKSLHQLAILFRPINQMAKSNKTPISQEETEKRSKILHKTEIIPQENQSESESEEGEDEEFETCPESYLLIEPFEESFSFIELNKIVWFLDCEEKKFRYVIVNHDSNMERWLKKVEPFFHCLKDKTIKELFKFGIKNSVCKDTILSSLWSQTDEVFTQLKKLNDDYNTKMNDCRIKIEKFVSGRQELYLKVDNLILKLNESYEEDGMPNLERAQELENILEKMIIFRINLEQATGQCFQIIQKKQELHLQNIQMLKEIQNNIKTKADQDESCHSYSFQSQSNFDQRELSQLFNRELILKQKKEEESKEAREKNLCRFKEEEMCGKKRSEVEQKEAENERKEIKLEENAETGMNMGNTKSVNFI